MDYAKHLIERILSAPDNERVAVLSNELLREFQRGYPLDDLEALLTSKDSEVVSVAVWITSELGERGRPLLPYVIPLLSSPKQGTRFWALDCLFWAQPDSPCYLAQAIQLLDDPEVGIRRKVLWLLHHFSGEQLRAASQCSQQLSGHLHAGLEWLLSSNASIPSEVKRAINSNDPVSRRFGVAAAARLERGDVEPLQLAAQLKDEDVSEFANRLLSD